MDMNSFLRVQWDRVTAVALIVLGGIALLLGWIGVSGTALSYKQLPYIISGGLFGVVLIGVGLTLYLSADLRDEWRKLDALEDSLNEAVARLTPENTTESSPQPAAPAPKRAAGSHTRTLETTAS